MSPTHNAGRSSGSADWSALPLDEWNETYATLHRWTQNVGKVRLTRMPWINHSWHSTLYVTCRGLTTSPMPLGPRSFQIDFDFIDHQLLIRTTDGDIRTLDLRPRSVVDFFRELMATLRELGFAVEISAVPNEMEDATPFDADVLWHGLPTVPLARPKVSS